MMGFMTFILFVACLGSALTGQAGASRLLYGMGRDGVISRRIFAHIDPKHSTPVRGIYVMGAVSVAGSLARPELKLSTAAQHQANPKLEEGGGSCGCDRGKVTENRLPAPSSLSTAIVPWWASTIRRTTSRPKPTPPVARVRLGSLRKNGSKMRD